MTRLELLALWLMLLVVLALFAGIAAGCTFWGIVALVTGRYALAALFGVATVGAIWAAVYCSFSYRQFR